jgi:hypothetical protein
LQGLDPDLRALREKDVELAGINLSLAADSGPPSCIP